MLVVVGKGFAGQALDTLESRHATIVGLCIEPSLGIRVADFQFVDQALPAELGRVVVPRRSVHPMAVALAALEAGHTLLPVVLPIDTG